MCLESRLLIIGRKIKLVSQVRNLRRKIKFIKITIFDCVFRLEQVTDLHNPQFAQLSAENSRDIPTYLMGDN